MATGLTLAVAQAHLDEWVAADSAVSSGQSYSIDGRSLTRANVADIRDQITYWNNQVNSLTAKAAGNNNGGVSIASF